MEDLEFLEDMSLSSTALEDVMQYVQKLEEAKEEEERISRELEAAKSKVETLSKKILPDLLLQHGLEELKLSNGKKVVIKEDVFVSVPKDPFKKRRVFQWLIEQGAGALIKEELIVESPPKDIIDELVDRGLSCSKIEDVNTNSLKAFFREGLGLKKGIMASFSKEDVPEECNVYIAKEAKIL